MDTAAAAPKKKKTKRIEAPIVGGQTVLHQTANNLGYFLFADGKIGRTDTQPLDILTFTDKTLSVYCSEEEDLSKEWLTSSIDDLVKNVPQFDVVIYGGFETCQLLFSMRRVLCKIGAITFNDGVETQTVNEFLYRFPLVCEDSDIMLRKFSISTADKNTEQLLQKWFLRIQPLLNRMKSFHIQLPDDRIQIIISPATRRIPLLHNVYKRKLFIQVQGKPLVEYRYVYANENIITAPQQ